MNITEIDDVGSGSGSMSNFTMNDTEFSCLNTDLLSSTMVTNKTFWQIFESLQSGTPYVATVVFIFFGLSFFWNLFIIVTYLVKFRLLKEPGNIFLFSLALYDILASVVMTLFTFIIEVRKEYIFGNDDVTRCRTCDLVGFFFVFVVSGSLHLLTALSVDRFILLSRPLRYKKIMNYWKAIIIVIFITLLSFFFSILPIAVGFGQYEFNRRFGICIARLSGTSRSGIPNQAYFTFIIIEALIPIAILSVTNVFTFRIVKKFLSRNFRRRSTYRKREEQSQDKKKHGKQQNQLVKVFGALFIANAITWSLIIIIILIVNFFPANLVPDQIFIFGWICYLTNPLFHPILESFFVKDLRLVVNRAKKEVRRASTIIVKQSSKMFTRSKASALDEANARMDREERAMNMSNINSSVATEAFSMSTASPNLSSRYSPDPEDVERNGEIRVRPKSLRSAGRSVTFSANPEEEATTHLPNGGLERKPNSVLKKNGRSNKKFNGQPLTDSIVEEDESAFGTSKSEDCEAADTEVVAESETKVLVESQVTADSENVTAESEEAAAENGSAPLVDDSLTILTHVDN